jgi:Domain of unknown function (DUF5658)
VIEDRPQFRSRHQSEADEPHGMSSDDKQPDPPEPRQTTFWSFLFRDKLPLEKETCWFILVNLLDFFASYILFRRPKMREANPVALWFIEGWGLLKGMLMYKLLMVAFVCVVVQLIALKNVHAAQRVLYFGIIVVAGVVAYSVVLLWRTGGFF